jgi:hypothetical protein
LQPQRGIAYLLIHLNAIFRFLFSDIDMKPPEAPRPDQDKPPPKLSRLEEARRIIETYATDLREIIKKLRRKLN